MTDELDGDRERPVICSDCESHVELIETPYEQTTFVVACDCDRRQIDVSDCTKDNALFEPITGKWSSFTNDEC